MALVLTSRPGSGVVDDEFRARARSLVAAQDAAGSLGDWHLLAVNDACELPFGLAGSPSADRVRLLRQALADLLADAAVDVNIVDAGPRRRKRLLIADMDSTIIEQECIDEMADMVGVKPAIAAITDRAMRGELDFEAALTERVMRLRGLTEEDLARVYEDRVTLMTGARTLLATMRANGAFTALVSGGFTFFASRVAARAGFQASHANELEIMDGRMTGCVFEPILGREAKLATLQRYTLERNLEPADTLAVGDGANDLAMIQAAGLGVAYRAKPIVAAAAQTSIRHGDLTALLYLQGYVREEFKSPA